MQKKGTYIQGIQKKTKKGLKSFKQGGRGGYWRKDRGAESQRFGDRLVRGEGVPCHNCKKEVRIRVYKDQRYYLL